MRMFFAALVAACLFGCANSTQSASTGSAAPAANGQVTISGILIDQHCGATMMTKDDPQAAAAKHPRSCAMADDCAASGYAVISGKAMVKFDDNGNKLAKDFLANSSQTDNLQVTVVGTQNGDTLAVSSLTAGGN